MIVWIYHHVPCLEVAIEETIHLLGCEVFGQQSEVGFQLHLVKVQICSLQETVFEIIQVKQHIIDIELRLRIAVFPVESTCSTKLDIGQFTNGSDQQLLLLLVVTATRIASTFQCVKQGNWSQVGLQIPHLVIVNSQNFRHRQLPLREMLGKIDKRMVLITTRSHDTNDAFSLRVGQSIIQSVTACARKLFDGCRLLTTPPLI